MVELSRLFPIEGLRIISVSKQPVISFRTALKMLSEGQEQTFYSARKAFNCGFEWQ